MRLICLPTPDYQVASCCPACRAFTKVYRGGTPALGDTDLSFFIANIFRPITTQSNQHHFDLTSKTSYQTINQTWVHASAPVLTAVAVAATARARLAEYVSHRRALKNFRG